MEHFKLDLRLMQGGFRVDSDDKVYGFHVGCADKIYVGVEFTWGLWALCMQCLQNC